MFLIYFLLFFSQNLIDSDHNTMLKTYVSKDGLVDYSRLANNKKMLVILIDDLKKNKLQFKNEKQEMVFWVNTYNLVSLYFVVKYKIVRSIKEINETQNSNLDVWKIKVPIANKQLSLDDIEHEILRKKFNDSRFHFLINPASKGSPNLLNELYTVEKLDSQLTKRTHLFFAREQNFKINLKENTLYISKIFEWYKKDFYSAEKGESIFDFIIKYAPISISNFVAKNKTTLKVSYLEYDWNLNSN
jgi:hypothetical protein